MEKVNLQDIFKNNEVTSKLFMAEFLKFKSDVYPKIKTAKAIEEARKEFDRVKHRSGIVYWLVENDEEIDDKTYVPTEKDYERYVEYAQERDEEYEDCCPSESRDAGYGQATEELREFLTWLNS